jgi:hypothetical protein
LIPEQPNPPQGVIHSVAKVQPSAPESVTFRPRIKLIEEGIPGGGFLLVEKAVIEISTFVSLHVGTKFMGGKLLPKTAPKPKTGQAYPPEEDRHELLVKRTILKQANDCVAEVARIDILAGSEGILKKFQVVAEPILLLPEFTQDFLDYFHGLCSTGILGLPMTFCNGSSHPNSLGRMESSIK